MKRISLNLNEQLLKKLDREAEKKGISRSELIRRGLDYYLQEKDNG